MGSYIGLLVVSLSIMLGLVFTGTITSTQESLSGIVTNIDDFNASSENPEDFSIQFSDNITQPASEDVSGGFFNTVVLVKDSLYSIGILTTSSPQLIFGEGIDMDIRIKGMFIILLTFLNALAFILVIAGRAQG